MINLPALVKARIWLGIAMATQIGMVLLPHDIHFSLHFLLAALGLLFSMFSGGFYMQDLLSDQVAILAQEHMTDEEIKQALDETMR